MYSKYYKEKLLINTFIYNPCFLITITNSIFRVINIQINNIIILGNKYFLVQEKYKLIQANYITKPKKKLLVVIFLLFNRYIFLLDKTNINLRQKKQVNKL
jgi:hypothetical protein